MSNIEESHKTGSFWAKAGSIGGLLVGLTATAALIFQLYVQSQNSAMEHGRLTAQLSSYESREQDYREQISKLTLSLEEAQKSAAQLQVNASNAELDLERYKELFRESQAKERELADQLSKANSIVTTISPCQRIQQRIAEIETRLARYDLFAPSPQERDELKEQLIEHQSTLRECLTRIR